MKSKDGLVKIKWAEPNSPYIELTKNGQRFYPTKRELMSIREVAKTFINSYPGDFAEDKIDLVDNPDYTMMPDVRKLMQEQEFSKKRWEALDKLAAEAGFTDDAFAHTEFSLMPFFERIVEECARAAEMQGRVYDGSGSESNGCSAAAHAIRHFGKTIGVKKD